MLNMYTFYVCASPNSAYRYSTVQYSSSIVQKHIHCDRKCRLDNLVFFSSPIPGYFSEETCPSFHPSIQKWTRCLSLSPATWYPW